MSDRYVAKRVINLFLIVFITLAGHMFFASLYDRFWDERIVYLIIDLIFSVLFLFVLERSRMSRLFGGNRETVYSRIVPGYLFAWLLLIAGSFLPEFLRPVLLIAILMTAVGTHEISLCTGIFLDVVLCLTLECSAQELVLYCLLTLAGCMLAEAIAESRTRFWYVVAVCCLTTVLPGLFYYITYREVRMYLFLYGAAEGLLIDVLLLVFYQAIASGRDAELSDAMEDILEDAYPVKLELKQFSKADYNHAARVSSLAAKCAALVEADEKICAAAGFYYRIGILEGGSITENGVKIAQRECFPESVIRIISEYNGEHALPSSTESAIVHMVDGLIKKLELFDANTMSSDWNQDMVIYQTLNDFSAKGIYDRSGLGMNMFLKIREYLVNEKELL
ncbi:MAG: hypothetical protein HFI35_00655 [Roseburia sp.]|jgi:HD superfamily phosphodiesterase|nr:hypothetical protein [Roseburia sp.]